MEFVKQHYAGHAYREIYYGVNNTDTHIITISFLAFDKDVELKTTSGFILRHTYLPEIQKFIDETLARFIEEDKTPLDKLLDAIDRTLKAHHHSSDSTVYNRLCSLETALTNYRGGTKE